MRGFRFRAMVEDVHALIDARVACLDLESVALDQAAGRVLGCAITAGDDVPRFDRAAMDGYALRGAETFGADLYSPAFFRVIGRSRPGRAFDGAVGPGEAVEIATGAPIPAGADVVARVEGTRVEGSILRVIEPSAPGRHIGKKGEDLAQGSVILQRGRVLRPQDLGMLSVLGHAEVSVVRRPRVWIVSTGDELLAAGARAEGARFADMNGVMLAALVARDGGVAKLSGPLADDRHVLEAELQGAAAAADVVIVSGGSSTGPEDHAPSLVAEMGTLEVHGVALRPASPTGLGFIGRVPVALLPGNPVSCLCGYDLLARRLICRLAGRSVEWPYRSRVLPLADKLVSATGRMDYARVRIQDERVVPVATSGASILSSTIRADGFVVIPASSEGYPAGADVCVWLYDA